nr:ribonuclease H-like domain-containing protein [Tanacetum cinerariifolium]
MKTEPIKDYIFLPLWTVDPPFSQDPKRSHDDGFRPSSDDGKKVDEDLSKGNECNDQEKEDNVNITNNVNAATTNRVNAIGENISSELPFNLDMHALEDISTFNFSSDQEDDDAVADMNNLETTIQLQGTKDNADQARMKTEPIKDYIFLPLWTVDPPFSQDPKRSHDDGFRPSSDDGKKVDEDLSKGNECNDQEKEDNVNITNNVNAATTNRVNAIGENISSELPFNLDMHALEDISTFNFSSDQEDDDAVADMNNLETTIQLDRGYVGSGNTIQVTRSLTLVDLPNGKRAIGHTQEERVDYDEVFAPVARIGAIRLFLAYASFKDFVVYQMDAKSDFLYGKIEEEVYVYQPPRFEDPNFPDGVYKVEKALYGLHQAPRAWKELCIAFEKLMHEKFQMSYMKFGFIEFKNASIPMETQKPLLKDEDVKEVDVICIGHPKLVLCYPKDSPFDLVAYSDSDYTGASLDRKSTARGYQYLRSRLISWQCKKQTVVVNSLTKAEYVAASSYCE